LEREKLQDIEQAGKAAIGWWIDAWCRNVALNGQFLIKEYGRKVDSIHHIPKAFGRPAILTGSGPSLDSFPFDGMKEAATDWTIFASLSNASVWLYHGIVPDYVVAVDSAALTAKAYLNREVVDMLRNTTLLVPPTIHPDILHKWKGPIRVFRPVQPGVPLIDEVLPKMFTHMIEGDDARSRFFTQLYPVGFANAGCVVNTMIEVASYLGHEPQFLTGVDFGFPFGLPGCTRYKREDDTWIPDYQLPGTYISQEAPRMTTNGIWTTSEQLHYKLNLYIIWSSIKCHLYNLSPCSALGDTVPVVANPADIYTKWEDLTAAYPLKEDDISALCIREAEKMGIKRPQAKEQMSKPAIQTLPSASTTAVPVPMSQVPSNILAAFQAKGGSK